MIHAVKATSFADPKDIASFKKCKEAGGSDEECFKKGDNGIGCWGQSTAAGTGPCCALPPDDMVERWGSIKAAKNKIVHVESKDFRCDCVLKDRMPWKKNIHNGAGIDLNPDACAKLNLTPPVFISVTWRWAEEPTKKTV